MSRLLAALLLAAAAALPAADPPAGMVAIPGGSYKPLYAKQTEPRHVEPFFIDVTQVTNAQFLEFVRDHPEWRRSKVQRTLADANYLAHWAGDLDPGSAAPGGAPVTHVSWFAAQAYCEAHGKRLPTQDEWEYVARADATQLDASSDPEFLRQLLEWYSTPAASTLGEVSSAVKNAHGLRGLHGIVWEWVYDFNSTLVVGDSRGDGSLERQLFCGAGSLLAADVSNYAAFMRYAFRSSLKGDYCVGSLGFRGAAPVNAAPPVPATTSFATIYDLPGEWRTQSGQRIKLADFRGKPRLITMGFTSCKFACPRIIGDMHRIETALGADAEKVGFVFFSFDTENDSPEQMKSVQEENQLQDDHWTFAVSSGPVVRQLAVALDFKFQSVEGFFAHSNLIALLDADGNILHREETLGADIQPVLDALRQLLHPQ
ncbi:MAG: SUMF1/EgtB/PvdO family nonheme iron enzyme [Verrucomicrobiales bacterium]|nr:SUMF1/EgtB/PvdO family nonheme iron enzyme [Verrucomicrobiales bacterium]